MGNTSTTNASNAAKKLQVEKSKFLNIAEELFGKIFSYLEPEELINKYVVSKQFRENIIQNLKNRKGKIHVPREFETINKAYNFIEKNQNFMFNDNGEIVESSSESSVRNRVFHTIVLDPGQHLVEKDEDNQNLLNIECPVMIVGDPNAEKEDITVMGSFCITANGVHVEHLTIRGSKYNAVYVVKSSCTLADLIITDCGGCGVFAFDAVLNCLNIMVSKCQKSGAVAYEEGTIIFRGKRTLITGNCLSGNSVYHGLTVFGPHSRIQIVKPLTKEAISKENMGGGDLGTASGATLNQIKTTVTPASQLMEAKELSLLPKEYVNIKASVIESLVRTPAFRLMEAKELLYEEILSQKEYEEIEASLGFYPSLSSSSSLKRKRKSSRFKHVQSQDKKSKKGPGYRFRF
jgi:hypothetical protein